MSKPLEFQVWLYPGYLNISSSLSYPVLPCFSILILSALFTGWQNSSLPDFLSHQWPQENAYPDVDHSEEDSQRAPGLNFQSTRHSKNVKKKKKSNKEMGEGKEWTISGKAKQTANMQMMLCLFLWEGGECKSKPQCDHAGNSLAWPKSKWLIIMTVIIRRMKSLPLCGMNRDCFRLSKEKKKTWTKLPKCKTCVFWLRWKWK